MPPSSFRAYVNVLGSALFFFFIFIQINMFNALDPYLIHDFGIGTTALGNLSAYYFYATVLFLIPAGMLLDRFSTRRILIIAMGISVLATVGFACSHQLYQASIARFVIGLCGAFCLLSSIRLASRWFNSQHMAYVIGWVVTIAMIGGVCAQTPFTLMADHWGWRSSLWIDAALGVVLLLIIVAVVNDTPRERVHHPKEGSTAIADIIKDLLNVAKNPQNWLGGCYTALLNLPIFLLGAIWGSLYLTHMQHVNRAHASVVTMLLFVGTIVGSPIIGWASDKLQRRILPMLLGAITSLLLVLMIILIPHLAMPSLMLLFFLLGFCSSSQVITYSLIVESNPMKLTGSAEGLTSMLIMAGGFLQPIFGYLMQWHHPLHQLIRYSTGDFNRAMIIFPIAFTICIVICLFLKETRAQPAATITLEEQHEPLSIHP